MHLPLSNPAALLAAATLLSFSTPATAAASKPKNAILLSQVKSLTLTSHAKTTSRRVSPIPQLKCVSPPKLCSLPDVSSITTMRCLNTGSSYTSEDIEWSCTASLPPTLRLDRTEVICEGYDNADDPYILKGSCGVEYTVQLTDAGREAYPHLAGTSGWKTGGAGGGGGGEETDWSGVVFGIIFVGVLGWILWGACTQAGGGQNRQRRQQQPRTGGGGGGGGGWGGNDDDDDDPPPPYPGTGNTGGNTRRPKTQTTPTASSSSQQGWRPGFWTGLASGAAGGYMAGQRRNNNTNTFAGYNNNYEDTYGGGGGSRWGGSNRFGGGSGWGGAGPSRSSRSESSGPSHESTGFGSTSRR
ncbi:store-operated calcium entry-associated regulatory factor [Cercophora samala]|uniref:Store-operated calcium entry-associated regulatory factor n=1 Tax=Cercophora samala TaxID=330535 RepID=A0AA40DGV3_9PEZI|nr:store-operated calcium entry-associated regulatory factor [Cercophora samala]